MAYRLSCREAGSDCPGEFTCESKDELVEHAKLHAERAHPEMELPPAEKLDAIIHTV